MQRSSSYQLSQNAIMYISSGFEGSYILQVITVARQSQNEYIFCLTDGKLYIGGRFSGNLPKQIYAYSVVNVQCRFISKWMPMMINEIQLVSNDCQYLIGNAPITLHDYFMEQASKSQEKISMIRNVSKDITKQKQKPSNKQTLLHQKQKEIKKPKYPIYEDKTQKRLKLQVDSDSCQSKISTQKQKITHQGVGKIINQNINKVLTQKKKHHPIKQIESNSNYINYQTINKINNYNKQSLKIFKGQDDDLILQKKHQINNAYLDDLYERMPGWKILCRVNYLRSFVSAKGKKCLSFQLIDEHGCQRKAMFYYGTKGIKLREQQQILQQNKIFSFSGGQIVKPNHEQSCPIQIVFTQNSIIHKEDGIIIYAFDQKKLTKYCVLSDIQNDTQISIIGIIKHIQKTPFEKQKNYTAQESTKVKVKGTICSPKQLIQIQFSKNCFITEKIPQIGQICVLHNFKLNKVNNSIRLSGNNNTSRAYFSIVQPNQDVIVSSKTKVQQLLTRQLNNFCYPQNQPKWKQLSFYNLSEIKYMKRSINQILSTLDITDSSVYSEVLCSVSDIKVKRQYMGCPICKRATQQGQAYLWHCIKCSRMTEPVPTLILIVTLSDSTASLPIQVIGDKAQILLGIQGNQQERECHLQMVRFDNYLIKMKTDKSNFGEITTKIQQILKQQHRMVVDQIRRRTIDQKLKCQIRWQNPNSSLHKQR